MLAVHKVQKTLSKPFSMDGIDFSIHTHIGLSMYPEYASSCEELIRQSIDALYQAKTDLSDLVIFSGQDAAKTDSHSYSKDIERALSSDEFGLVYQPIFDTQSFYNRRC